MNDAQDVQARWSDGLRRAADAAYSRASGALDDSQTDAATSAPAGPARWRIAPRAAVAAGVVLVLIAVAAWWGLRPASTFALPGEPGSPPTTSSTPAESVLPSTPAPTALPVFVHVAGAVKHPGLVELPAGSRIADAIEAAGGLTGDAQPGSVNLARIVADGEQVLVATQEAAAASAGAGQGAAGAGGAGSGGGLININTADAAGLEELPGVGPVLAQRIISDREKNGPFASIDDLDRVSGVGPAILESLAQVATS